MKRQKLFPLLAAVVLLALFGALCGMASASPCSNNQYDMAEWIQMSSSLATSEHMTGTANPLYYADRLSDSPVEIIQMKGANGYPWDVDILTATHIYQWATENVWGDPTTYKAFVTKKTMPWMPRCITIPSTPGKLSSITVPNPSYYTYGTNCNLQNKSNLGNTVNEVWGPYSGNFGGNLPNPSTYLELAYRYSCDASYDNCTYKETFDWVQNYGLVRWTYFILQKGTYVQQQQNYFNTITQDGAPTPNTPCFS